MPVLVKPRERNHVYLAKEPRLCVTICKSIDYELTHACFPCNVTTGPMTIHFLPSALVLHVGISVWFQIII